MNFFAQVASLLGAALILGAFMALQRGMCDREDKSYLWANLVGATALTLVALWDRRLGFILLEATWALVSLHAILTGSARSAEA